MDLPAETMPLEAACSAHHGNKSSKAPICCCDSSECATFQQNQKAVYMLEQDVRQAAYVGQALLERHESYVAGAEVERARLNSTLAKLESTNSELATDNLNLSTENKALLHQVESLNAAVISSDSHIDSLTATLHSAQHEIQRLAVLASRTQHLEMQLAKLEAEQAQLQSTLTTTKDDERMATQRWRESERALADLSVQMEQIEREAAEERRRHAEVVERMERRTSVEKELGSAALRLKHAAGQDSHKSNEVVSNFVKEILSDNATLQLNMVELQDLLSSSRDEMELLRDQLADAYADGSTKSPYRASQPLSRELASSHERNPSSELHVHHHYHAPQTSTSLASSRGRGQGPLRSRKKKLSFSSQLSSGSARTRSPQRYSRMHSNQGSVSSINRPMSSHRSKRWSANSIMTQSSFVSSGPSSPRSASVAPSTIFERALADDGTVYTATEYSRPTSPESNGLGSPEMLGMCKEEGPEDQEFRTFSLPSPGFALCSRQNLDFGPLREEEDETPRKAQINITSHVDNNNSIPLGPGVTIRRGSPFRSPNRSPTRSPARSPVRTIEHERGSPKSRPPTRLRRKASQSSLYSISGMDIHSSFTPAASNLSPKGAYKRPTVLRQTGPSTYIHSGPILTAATAQAKASQQGFGAGSGRALLENLAPGTAREDRAAVYSPLSDTFGRGWRVGGWLSSRWKNTSSSGNLKSDAIAKDTAGGLERVDENDAGSLKASSVHETSIEAGADEWHNEEAQRRIDATMQGKQLPDGKSLRRTTRSVLQTELDEASLRECLDEDAVV